VAAPIALVGVVSWPATLPIDLSRMGVDGPLAVFRLTWSSSGDAGTSAYPSVPPTYAIVAPGGKVEISGRRVQLRVGSTTIDCDPASGVQCFGGVPAATESSTQPQGSPFLYVAFSQPVVIAGIDPAAEAKVAGLDRCLTSGRYLTTTDEPTATSLPTGPQGQTSIPILLSERSFIDESLSIRVERAADAGLVLGGTPPAQLEGWQSAKTQTTAADEVYCAHLDTVAKERFYNTSALWSPGDVHYQFLSPDHLIATTQPADFSIFENPFLPSATPQSLVPIEARDLWFRKVSAHPQILRGELPNGWLPIGRYDPQCIPGFDPLVGGHLESYALPSVRLADGRHLGPTRSMAGYLNSPPLALTTLEGAAWFANPKRFEKAPGAAFLSAIRVRVAGTEKPGTVAEGRLSRIAGEIHEATDLAVDIVVGSSPRTIQVDLAAGNFGRPPLTVSEGWSVKGVAFRFSRAVTAQNLALFALVLIGATILVGETALISVRRRRAEFGVLRALGWPARRIAWLVELEMLLLGVAAGCIALVLGTPLAIELGLGPMTWQIVAAVPLAIAVAGLAAILPALAAGHGTTVSVIRGGGNVRLSQPPRSILSMALRDLATQSRTEAALGVAAVALGAAMLGGVVLMAAAFRGQLDASLLGTYLAVRVRPFHTVLAVLTLGIGALAAGEIVTLGYLERQPQLATLRALGWPRLSIVRLLAIQAATLGLVGGTIGAILVVIGGVAFKAPPVAIVLSGLLDCLLAMVVTALAVVGPLFHAYYLSVADALRGE
jgi:hypothetical protein